jgi:hypothetical protein
MATARPPSIGDEKPELVLVRDSKPLPKSRTDILAEVSHIFALGGVQRVIIEVGKPLFFDRLVPKSEVAEDETTEEIPADAVDLYGAMRNNELLNFELKYGSMSGQEALFKAWRLLSSRKLAAKGFLVSDFPALREWLDLGEEDSVDDIFGVPVFKHAEIPADVIILVAVDAADPEDVKLSLRITLD